jgi:hypothetical protein
MPATRARTIAVLRLLTKLSGLALFIVVALQSVAEVGGHHPAAGEPTLKQTVALDLRFLMLSGLLVAAGWEGIGGLTVAVAGMALCAYGLTFGVAGPDMQGALAVLVGLAFLACGWPSSRSHLAKRATRPLPARGPSGVRWLSAVAGCVARRARQPGWVAHWLPGSGPARRLEMARARLESGQGGDVETGGRVRGHGRGYVPSLKRTVSAWVRLRERVERGDLGGAYDAGTPPDSLPPVS